jgi:hypothetical protein
VDWEADRAGGVEEARVICKEGVGANSERSGEEAGRAITFASDAHTTDALAGNFYEAHGNGGARRLPPRPSPRGLLDPLTVLRWSVGLPTQVSSGRAFVSHSIQQKGCRGDQTLGLRDFW